MLSGRGRPAACGEPHRNRIIRPRLARMAKRVIDFDQSMKRPLKNLKSSYTHSLALTSAVLATCLLIGQGFREPNFASEPFERSIENYIASSAPIDTAFTSGERQIRVQNKAPRRQVSFGAAPPSSMLEMPASCCRGAVVESPCPSSAIPARPNDRAPPMLTS